MGAANPSLLRDDPAQVGISRHVQRSQKTPDVGIRQVILSAPRNGCDEVLAGEAQGANGGCPPGLIAILGNGSKAPLACRKYLSTWLKTSVVSNPAERTSSHVCTFSP